ncbi:TPA: hypothetical protein ACIFDL_002576 [Acinetobacter nosocomialis]|uniref:hypothetical protein n=1 Tax=Acinetobacter nosocomialis TaxID=106654 RepID=UPI0034CFAF8C
MKKTILSSCLLISLAFIGCSREVEIKPLPPSVEAQYISANKQIEDMLDALEKREVPLEMKREILCKTYPEVYKNHYMPALLKLSPHQYSEEVLLRDYEAVISFYEKAFVINCGQN